MVATRPVPPEPDPHDVLDVQRRRTQARIAALERDHAAIVRAVAADPPDDEHDPEGRRPPSSVSSSPH